MRPASIVRTLCAAALVPLVPSAALAQAPAVVTPPSAAAAPATGADPVARARITAMRHMLRNLVVAQERYFADHRTYTTDLMAIWGESSGPQKPDSNVVIHVTHAGARAWRATAEHRELEGRSCVIFIGDPAEFPLPATRAANLSPRPDHEGVALCDTP